MLRVGRQEAGRQGTVLGWERVLTSVLWGSARRVEKALARRLRGENSLVASISSSPQATPLFIHRFPVFQPAFITTLVSIDLGALDARLTNCTRLATDRLSHPGCLLKKLAAAAFARTLCAPRPHAKLPRTFSIPSTSSVRTLPVLLLDKKAAPSTNLVFHWPLSEGRLKTIRVVNPA